ncbi:histidine kinase [Actinoplanes sp. NPDC051470]|uniref:sensor histidine kinase n=1 Tax=Actinoplanes sp. NPDC051470 TaxID=3157224 RepID=UPI00343067E5
MVRPAGFPWYEATLAATLAAATAGLSLLGSMPPVTAALLAVADLALVALRRRFPAAVLIVAAATMAVPGRADFLLAFGLAFAAGFRIRGPWRLTGTLAAVLVLQVGGLWLRDRTVQLSTTLLTVGTFLVLSAFPATLARLSAQRRRILTLMHERTVYLNEQQRIIAERARAREANRIAREMHDSLGHRLTLLSLYAGALRSAPEQSAETVRLLHATSVTAMEELRHILTVLRDESAEPDGDHDVDKLVADARGAGAQIELTRSGPPVDVPRMIEHAAYRTLQEGVTNALRHARGGAIRAALRFEDDALVAEVVNEPGRRGDGPAGGGQGLYGLAERIRLAGGVLYHGVEPDGGFRVAATLPLTAVAPMPAAAGKSGGAVDVPDEFGADLRRVDSRRRLWTVVVGVSALVVVGLCAGGIWVAVRQQTVDSATFERVRVGDSAVGVREKLPDRDAALDPARVLPAAPAGGDCVAYRAAPTLRPAGVEGYRFCFGAGALISKEELADVD